jgi:hypothetical protein
MSSIKQVVQSLGLMSALALSALSHSAPAAAWTYVGNFGTASADGVVNAPPGGGDYLYVISNGAATGLGFGLGDEQNGSRARLSFSANVGDRLEYAFNYVTSDGGDYTDYAWARLLDGALNPVAMLFSARTAVSGDTVPGNGLPALDVTLNLPSPAFNPGDPGDPLDTTDDNGPAWSPLGGSSGACFDVGCGHTGWITMSYEFTAAGSYVLEVGVVNWSDGAYDSGLAFTGTLVPVPEPETYAMMLAGLGLLAWMAHRRKGRA